jgi:hypothetical protein
MSTSKKTISATPRQLESLIRLAEAHAKMRLSNVLPPAAAPNPRLPPFAQHVVRPCGLASNARMRGRRGSPHHSHTITWADGTRGLVFGHVHCIASASHALHCTAAVVMPCPSGGRAARRCGGAAIDQGNLAGRKRSSALARARMQTHTKQHARTHACTARHRVTGGDAVGGDGPADGAYRHGPHHHREVLVLTR